MRQKPRNSYYLDLPRYECIHHINLCSIYNFKRMFIQFMLYFLHNFFPSILVGVADDDVDNDVNTCDSSDSRG